MEDKPKSCVSRFDFEGLFFLIILIIGFIVFNFGGDKYYLCENADSYQLSTQINCEKNEDDSFVCGERKYPYCEVVGEREYNIQAELNHIDDMRNLTTAN